MSKPLVSVVVPVFNGAEYIGTCVRSILLQRCNDFELVIVDDGSTDDTARIIDELARSDPRLRVFHHSNQGVAYSRNYGMREAQGDYLYFVDADDILPPDTLDILIGSIQTYDSDMAYGKYEMMYEENIFCSHEFDAYSNGLIPLTTAIESLASVSPDSLSGSCWRILFRKTFLSENLISFPEGVKMSEDFCFILDCFGSKPSVSFTDSVVYRIRRGSGSSTQRYMPSLQEDMDFVNKRLFTVCKGDTVLEAKCNESIANTCWCVCRNMFKPGAELNQKDRYRKTKTTLNQYSTEIKKVKICGSMPAAKVLLLKVGLAFPALLVFVLKTSVRQES